MLHALVNAAITLHFRLELFLLLIGQTCLANDHRLAAQRTRVTDPGNCVLRQTFAATARCGYCIATAVEQSLIVRDKDNWNRLTENKVLSQVKDSRSRSFRARRATGGHDASSKWLNLIFHPDRSRRRTLNRSARPENPARQIRRIRIVEVIPIDPLI